jgi:tRNA (uracil-5-)-methyltransferase TRM9
MDRNALGGADAPSLGRSYDRYYRSGLYRSRYPGPNRRTLRHIAALLRPGDRILDFGCGDGRYAIPLVRDFSARCVAFDISEAALGALREAAPDLLADGRLAVVGPDFPALEAEVSTHGPFRLILLLFGVIGHVARREARVALLRRLATMLAPDGRIMLGAPNVARRFRPEQDAARAAGLPPGDVRYERHAGGETIDLFYHLYDEAELRSELAEAGFAVESCVAESILPERRVVSSRLAAALDSAFAAALPTRWAWGFLATAGLAVDPKFRFGK